jgi:WD40 repeat protein
MMDESMPTTPGDRPLRPSERIDAVCDRFEADWRAGGAPRIDDFLAEAEEADRPALRDELLALERELRRSKQSGLRSETASHASAFSEVPTIPPGTVPLRPVPGAISPSIHAQATLTPSDARAQPSIADTGAPNITETVTTTMAPAAASVADGSGSKEATETHTARMDSPFDTTTSPDQTSPGQAKAASPVRIRYFGDYEITSEIARGGMGVVFRAKQMSLNRPVALKMILAGQLANEQEVRRFYTEAEAAANLDHPGIVPIFEIGEHEGQHYFSMGFVEGQSLSHRLAAGPVPVREAAAVMVKVAEAIEYAHRRGVIHRDLKPANILIDAAGNPRVTDFGLAKQIHSDSGLTGSGQIMGTPSYMPPEQAGGERGAVGPPADVYSLGATLYALVTGRPPFQAASAMDTVLMVISDEPVPPRRLNVSVPVDLETICLKCLQKDPAKRYATAFDFAADLRRFLAGEPIVARPVTALERAAKWLLRRPAMAALLGVLALAVATVFMVSLYYSLRLRDSNMRLNSALGIAREQERLARDQERLAREHQAMTWRSLYSASMGLAQEAWLGRRKGYIRRIREFLEPWQPKAGATDLRSFEWYFLNQVVHAELRENVQDIDSVLAVAASADGRWIAVGDEEDDHTGALRLLDAASGRLLWKRRLPAGIVALAFSPEGALLASASAPKVEQAGGPAMGSVTLHDLKTGEEKAKAGRVAAQPALAFSKDGSELLIADVRSIWPREKFRRVWRADSHTGREIASFDVIQTDPTGAGNKDFYVTVAEFSLDRGSLAIAGAGSRRQVYLLDSRAGTFRGLLEGGDGWITSLKFAADGSRVVGCASNDTILLWNMQSAIPVWVAKQHFGGASAVAISPDGRMVAAAKGVGLDGELVLRETGQGKKLATLLAHEEGLTGLVWLPQGHTLVSASRDNSVKWWDTSDLGLPETFNAGQGTFTAMTAVADIPLLVVATLEPSTLLDRVVGLKHDQSGRIARLRWWNARTQSCVAIRALSSAARCLAVSPDGKQLAVVTEDGQATLWEMATQRQLPAAPEWAKGVRVATWSRDGRLALGTSERGVTVWEPRTLGQPKARLNCDSPVTALAWSPDSRRLAAAGPDRDAIVWNVALGNAELQLKRTKLNDRRFIAFSPDGRRLATDLWFDAALWETSSWRFVGKLHGHAARMTDLAFAPDGLTIATAASDDAARLWDPETGQERVTFRKDEHAAEAVCFLENGHVLAVCWKGPQDKLCISCFKATLPIPGSGAKSATPTAGVYDPAGG